MTTKRNSRFCFYIAFAGGLLVAASGCVSPKSVPPPPATPVAGAPVPIPAAPSGPLASPENDPRNNPRNIKDSGSANGQPGGPCRPAVLIMYNAAMSECTKNTDDDPSSSCLEGLRTFAEKYPAVNCIETETDGTIVVIKETHDGLAPRLRPESANPSEGGWSPPPIATKGPPAPGTKVSTNGHAFAPSLEYPQLGKTWVDERGWAWGDVFTDGEAVAGTQYDAINYCLSIGAKLPSNSQFSALSSFLGRGSPEGYKPQILPHLGGFKYWSATSENDQNAFTFNGTNGFLQLADSSQQFYVRCLKH